MSTFIIIFLFFLYIRFLLSGLGPEAYVALLLVNTHHQFFLKDLRSHWDIFTFLLELYSPN